MPGIQISTAVRTGPTNATVRESSQAFFVGKASRGPVDEALLVTSLEDFELKYGGYVSGYYLHSTVESFFEEGGTQCYVARVETADATTASVAVPNSASTTVITLTANGPGAWATGNAAFTQGLSFTVSAGSITGARSLALFLDGDLIMTTGSCATNLQMVGKINTHPVASLYVTAVEDLAGTAAAGTMPAINAVKTNFTGGAAGVATIQNSQYETALTYFLESYGAGIVSIPEVPSTSLSTTSRSITGVSHSTSTNLTTYTTSADHGFAVGDEITVDGVTTALTGDMVISTVPTTTTFTVSRVYATSGAAADQTGSAIYTYPLDAVTLDLIAHANSHSRVVALHGASDDTTTEIKALAQVVQAQDNAEHIAVYYPWVYAPTGTVGANRPIPPSGYVAGARSRAHNQVGPHQPGAGIISDARFINGVTVSIDKTAGDALDADCVNAIRVINNRVRIYGARSCSADTTNFRYLNAQEVVNYVVVQANRALEDVLFSLIDGRGGMFASIEAHLVAVMEPLRTLGALYEAFDVNGRRIDFGYTVKCNESLNPLSQLVNGTVTARVGLRVSSVGDSIQVEIIKSNLTASVV
jgi:hypothetical protein